MIVKSGTLGSGEAGKHLLFLKKKKQKDFYPMQVATLDLKARPSCSGE